MINLYDVVPSDAEKSTPKRLSHRSTTTAEEGWGEMASAMEEDPFEQRAVQLFTPEVP